jgi:hypothetical protein
MNDAQTIDQIIEQIDSFVESSAIEELDRFVEQDKTLDIPQNNTQTAKDTTQYNLTTDECRVYFEPLDFCMRSAKEQSLSPEDAYEKCGDLLNVLWECTEKYQTMKILKQ